LEHGYFSKSGEGGDAGVRDVGKVVRNDKGNGEKRIKTLSKSYDKTYAHKLRDGGGRMTLHWEAGGRKMRKGATEEGEKITHDIYFLLKQNVTRAGVARTG